MICSHPGGRGLRCWIRLGSGGLVLLLLLLVVVVVVVVVVVSLLVLLATLLLLLLLLSLLLASVGITYWDQVVWLSQADPIVVVRVALGRRKAVWESLKREVMGPRGMGVVSNSWLIVFFSQFFTCSKSHVDRCSNPLPWDTLSSP